MGRRGLGTTLSTSRGEYKPASEPIKQEAMKPGKVRSHHGFLASELIISAVRDFRASRSNFDLCVQAFPVERFLLVRLQRFLPLLLIGVIGYTGGNAAQPASRPNVLFIAIDDLRNDLGALGAAHARTPQLDAFATTARVFDHHYVQVPTCGASRAALLRGRYPTETAHVSNSAIANTHPNWGDANLPAWFKRHGYQTFALGKITHHPGGLTGKQWAEGPEELPGAWTRCWIPDAPWKTSEAMMHAYANGKARTPGKTPPIEAFDGPDTAYPDAWVAGEAVGTLRELAKSKQPWFFAVGLFKPHLPFAAPKRFFDLHDPEKIPAPKVTQRPQPPSGWHKSGEFRNNYAHEGRDPEQDPAYARQVRRAYAASTSYVDAQAGRVLGALKELGLDDNTVVVVWGDHGFLLGEHAIWGKHCLYENALRSPLMIRVPGMAQAGRTSNAIVETVDLFPTLIEVCGLAPPAGLDGRSLRPQLANPAARTTKPALGFWTSGQRTIRDERWRLIAHAAATPGAAPEVELFDLVSDPDESSNEAVAKPKIVAELLARLPAPLGNRASATRK
jgi:iduronate 2-sulfatase